MCDGCAHRSCQSAGGVSVAEALKYAANAKGDQEATPLTRVQASRPSDVAWAGGGRTADAGELGEERRRGGGVYVSIVLAARNDGHEGNFILRFNKSFHYLYIFVDRIVLIST